MEEYSKNLFFHRNLNLHFVFSTTLTRTETGLPPPFETIGKPTIGLLETGIDLANKTAPVLYKRQWFNSEYVSSLILKFY
jgi:hypothetical protein